MANLKDEQVKMYARLYQVIYWLRIGDDILEVQRKLELTNTELYDALVELTKAGFLKVSVA